LIIDEASQSDVLGVAFAMGKELAVVGITSR